MDLSQKELFENLDKLTRVYVKIATDVDLKENNKSGNNSKIVSCESPLSEKSKNH